MDSTDFAELRRRADIFWTEDVLRFADTDLNGHVNNRVCSIVSENARIRFLSNAQDISAGPRGLFVLAEINIVYRAEIFYPGSLTTATWVDGIGNTSMRFRQQIYDGNRRHVAEVSARCVFLDQETRKPTRIPDGFRPPTMAE